MKGIRERLRGSGTRWLVAAGALALLVPGGIAVGAHSGGNGRPAKTLVAPYTSAFDEAFTSCFWPTDSCFVEAQADATAGTLAASGYVSRLAPVPIFNPDTFAYARVSATDSFRRNVSQRGYTITFHVDRADFSYGSGYPFVSLSVSASHPGCGGCGDYASTEIWPERAGQDVVLHLDLPAMPAGAVTINASLEGYLGSYSLLPGGGSSYDVQATVSKIEVFR